jgi:hypothetical protein
MNPDANTFESHSPKSLFLKELVEHGKKLWDGTPKREFNTLVTKSLKKYRGGDDGGKKAVEMELEEKLEIKKMHEAKAKEVDEDIERLKKKLKHK